MPTSARRHRFSICRGGRLCPPGMAHNIFVGQGPRTLPVGVVENRFGSSGRPTPTHHLPIELRRGRRPRRPAASQVAGDRKGRPYGGVTRSAVRWADVGSEPSAASGSGSEVSEWPRSKFPASAVRQRRNFGHRNRIIGPYEFLFSWGLHI